MSLTDLVAIQQSASPPHEKERAMRAVIFGDEHSGGADPLPFLLSHFSGQASDTIAAAFEAVEAHSPLFADLLTSSHYPALLHFLESQQSEGEASHRIASAVLSMTRLSYRLTGPATPADHLAEATALSLSLIASPHLPLAEQAARLARLLLEGETRGAGEQRLLALAQEKAGKGEGVTVCRYLSLAIDLMRESETAALRLIALGFPALLFALCRGSDLLLQLTALDQLVVFATAGPACLEELLREGLLDWLLAVASKEDSDPLLQAEVLRVLAAVFREAARHSSRFVARIDRRSVEAFLKAIDRRLEDGSEEDKITSLAVLADFSRISGQSLALLRDFDGGALLQEWLALLNSSKVELSSAALAGLAKVMDQTEEQFVENGRAEGETIFSFSAASDPTVELERITEFKKHLFNAISTVKGVPTAHFLVKAAKQPIPSLRNAAMDFMRAVAAQPAAGWGLPALFGSNPAGGEFWTYLRDRTTESTKEGRDFKFALIQTLAQSPFVELLDGEIQTHLKHMVAQGAYYMPPRMEDPETI